MKAGGWYGMWVWCTGLLHIIGEIRVSIPAYFCVDPLFTPPSYEYVPLWLLQKARATFWSQFSKMRSILKLAPLSAIFT
jgi:hypothetical protein